MDVGSSADVTEMEVSVEISGIARRRETKSVSFAVFGALGENEEERVKENDEVVRVNEKEEEEYRKDLQFLVEKETEDEEEEDTSQCSEQEEQVKEAKQAMEVTSIGGGAGGGRDPSQQSGSTSGAADEAFRRVESQ